MPAPARPLDRQSPLPLWAQLLADLRRRLASGAMVERFPTERELTADYGVSRNTVREAVGRLASQGLLERHRGLGTLVRTAELEQPLGALYSLFRAVEAQGLESRSRVLALDERTHAGAAGHLGLPGDARLVHLARLRLAGGSPLAVDRAWMPADLARPLLEVDFRGTALYDELAARCGVGRLGGEERIRPVVPAEGDRRLLDLPAPSAAFAIERLTRSADRPIEYRQSVVRGDRYSFVAHWSPESSYTAAMAAEMAPPSPAAAATDAPLAAPTRRRRP